MRPVPGLLLMLLLAAGCHTPPTYYPAGLPVFLDEGKAADVPANQKDKLPIMAGDLAKDAVKLREAAKAQDVEKVQEIQQRVHLKVRELRLDG